MSATLEQKPSMTAMVTAFAAIYLVWGSTYLGMHVAIETMPPFLMGAGRFGIAGALLLAWLAATSAAMPTRRQWVENLSVGAVMLVGGNGLVAWSLHYVPSGVAALIIAISPIFFVLIEWGWPGGERPSLLTFVGLALGFGGAAWLAAPWENGVGGHAVHVGGLLALVGACVLWPFGSIYAKHLRNPVAPFMASAVQMIGGGLGLGVVSLLAGEWAGFHLTGVSARSWGAFSYLVLVGSLVGFSTFVWLMKHTTPARASTYAYVNPVVAVFLGWLILDEHVDARTVWSAAVIIAGVVLITSQKGRRKEGKVSRNT
ncbi:EamA family transporter [Nibricoccus aquaticus]|nr:EamA family transporter [Nibricoccus aquaticus]